MPSSRRHIAVVGAGAFGGWTALHLLRMGARVTLLDAWGPGNSRSSSGGESRVIRGIYGSDRIYVQWVRRAFQLWRKNQERWNTQLYRQTGLLWMFVVDDEYARVSLPIVREQGFQVDQLEPSEARKRFPQINLATVRSLYFEHEAGYLRARQACQVVCEQFQQEGGAFRWSSATPADVQSGQLQGLVLGDGSHLSADDYVFACGPWLGSLFPQLIGDLIQPTRQDVLYFGVPSGDDSFGPDRLPIWMDFDERLNYGLPDIDGRGLKIADDTRGELIDPTHVDRSPSPQGVARARAVLAHRFPALKSAPLVESRVCQYENSPDGHLIIDRHPDAHNVWIAGGGSGHGFKLGPVVGEHLAKCILHHQQPEPFFSLQRLTRWNERSTQFDHRS